MKNFKNFVCRISKGLPLAGGIPIGGAAFNKNEGCRINEINVNAVALNHSFNTSKL